MRGNPLKDNSRDEFEWGFGQILSVILVFSSLSEIIEVVRRLREEDKAEQQEFELQQNNLTVGQPVQSAVVQQSPGPW